MRDLLVTNNRVRSEEAPKKINTWKSFTRHPFICSLCLSPPLPPFSGEQGPSSAPVPFPRLAGGGHPHRRQRHDQFNRSGAEAAAAVGKPPHHGALQVSSPTPPARRFHIDEGALWSLSSSFIALISSLSPPPPRLSPTSAGAGRTGTFCALSTVLERVKAEGILDVFQTVKSLRLQRPHMVQTLVRLDTCFHPSQQ